jgi:prepilin-type N-terminal cleavage/methylation domain-containing protein
MGPCIRSDCRDRLSIATGGFTIVELIAVLVLLGILSTVAMSRLVKGSSYAPSLVTQEVVALTRLGQQLAMARQDASVTFELASVASSWRFRVRADDGGGAVDARVQTMERGNTAISVTNGATTVGLASDTLVLGFDGVGNLSGVAVGTTVLDPSLGVEITVAGDSNRTVCVAASGYAYREACS